MMPAQARCPPELGRRLRLPVAPDGSAHANAAVARAARSAPRFGTTRIGLLSVQPRFSPLEGLLEQDPQVRVLPVELGDPLGIDPVGIALGSALVRCR
jgi:hypothetical protein